MARQLIPGSRLNEIWSSTVRCPEAQLLVWNPNEATIGEVACGTVQVAPWDLTPWVEQINFKENIGYESEDDPHLTQIGVRLRRNDNAGRRLRRGLLEDGVICRVLQGDRRIDKKGWLPIFTGTRRRGVVR